MRKTRYKTLHEYMDGTGTSQARLLKRVKEQTGRDISPQLFSMILRGSRRCSKLNAFALSIVTGIEMAELERWPRYAESESSQSIA